MSAQGKIIYLNGASSSGKSLIAQALQGVLDGSCIHTGLDHYLERVPERFHAHSDGVNPPAADGFLWIHKGPDGQVTEIRLGPTGLRMIRGLYRAAAVLAAEGNDLIIDDVLFDPQALREAVGALSPFGVLFVGVRCPLEVAEQRERDRGDRTLGLARAHHELVHAHGVYDMEVDTSIASPLECALQIRRRLLDGPAPSAFRRLMERIANEGRMRSL
jgi:chloramphenicol 3-O phosphotransferase